MLTILLVCVLVNCKEAETAAPDHRNGLEQQQEHCTAKKVCPSGLIIPIWQPQNNLDSFTILLRAAVYLLAMLYLFFGVSIVSERFMAAIEVITSQEREVQLYRITGEPYTVLIRIWNETVSNLTLMALGSSAPEILLSVIEIFGNNFQAGDLGPGTIVGSAAFNLFIIIAICICAIPSNETRKVQYNGVFWVTAIWSTFAYVWLYLILCVFSPEIIEVWEGISMFLFFPLTVISAYLANRFTKVLGRRMLDQKKELAMIKVDSDESSKRRDDNESSSQHKSSNFSQWDANMAAHEDERVRYLEIFRKLRIENPDAPIVQLEKLALGKILEQKPKSRAFYRVMASRKLTGSDRITPKSVDERTLDLISLEAEKIKPVVVGFEPINYVCLENVGNVKLHVKCCRSDEHPDCIVKVLYHTVAENAEEYSDFIPQSGELIFTPNEQWKYIEVPVIDNDVYEEDEQFLVRLRDPNAYQSGDQSCTVPVRFGASVATVLIIDDDHAGAFGFSSEKFSVIETDGVFVAEVIRTRGARGKVAVPYKTIDGSAKAGVDYISADGVLIFENEQTTSQISIQILNTSECDKSEYFYLELNRPYWYLTKPENFDNDPGEPILSGHSRCKVQIIEDREFANFVDRIVSSANTSLIVGTHSWKQQFNEAINTEVDVDQDEGPTFLGTMLRYISIPWKILFAFIPPTDYLNGWLCFMVAIVVIGILTALIGDLASHFGCTVGLKDSITAITLVAMGTSIPDTFASRTAAVQDKWADSSIGNVTGSNAVNVFLGIGIAWAIAAIYHAINGSRFVVDAGNIAFSVTLFLIGSIICIALLQYRHFSGTINGELGGPKGPKILAAVIFVVVWILYVVLSTLEAYCIIPGF